MDLGADGGPVESWHRVHYLGAFPMHLAVDSGHVPSAQYTVTLTARFRVAQILGLTIRDHRIMLELSDSISLEVSVVISPYKMLLYGHVSRISEQVVVSYLYAYPCH